MRHRLRALSISASLAVLAGGGAAYAQPQVSPEPAPKPGQGTEPGRPGEAGSPAGTAAETPAVPAPAGETPAAGAAAETRVEKAEKAAAIEAEVAAIKRPTPVFARELLRGPRRALEIGLDLGYTQGFGAIDGDQRVGDVVDAALGVGVSFGFRATPGLAVSALGGYQYFNADEALGSSARARGITAGIGFVFHLAPFRRIDPVVTVGSGYRVIWLGVPGPGNDVVLHGLSLAKSQVGLEIKVTPDVAIGPFAGADLDLMVWEDPEDVGGGVRAISARRFSTFVYAGLQGRFNVGGSRDQKAPTDIDLARR